MVGSAGDGLQETEKTNATSDDRQAGRSAGWIALVPTVASLFFPLHPMGALLGIGDTASFGDGLLVMGAFCAIVAISIQWRMNHRIDKPAVVALAIVVCLVTWQLVGAVRYGWVSLFLLIVAVPLFGGLALAIAGYVRYRLAHRPTA